MDFDFAKVLFVITAVAGLIWLLDILVLRRYRTAEDKRPSAVEYAASFFPVLLIVFVIRSFIFEPFQIPSRSMVPTLLVGDFLLVNKFSYGVRLPIIGTKVIPTGEVERGDVVVFIPPNDTRYFIKRVIGLPGDHVVVRENVVTVNGETLDQTFVSYVEEINNIQVSLQLEAAGDKEYQIRTMGPNTRFGHNIEIVVPDGHYYMMGDNRDESLDSRAWGSVPDENLVGKATFIWMHWKDWGIPSFSRSDSIK